VESYWRVEAHPTVCLAALGHLLDDEIFAKSQTQIFSYFTEITNLVVAEEDLVVAEEEDLGAAEQQDLVLAGQQDLVLAEEEGGVPGGSPEVLGGFPEVPGGSPEVPGGSARVWGGGAPPGKK